MNLKLDLRQISRRTLLIAAASLLLAAGLAVGGWFAYEKVSPKPVSQATGSKSVLGYLQKKSGQKEFKPTVDISKEKEPWRVMRVQYDAAADYPTVYRLIGEHLRIIEGLLNHAEPKQQRLGLTLMMKLCDVAVDIGYDGWLAARMCEAYLVPNFEKAESSRRASPNQEEVLRFVVQLYGRANETAAQIALYREMIARAPTPARADALRLDLGRLLERQGEHQQALTFLKEIKDPSYTNAASRRIEVAEKKVASKRQ